MGADQRILMWERSYDVSRTIYCRGRYKRESIIINDMKFMRETRIEMDRVRTRSKLDIVCRAS